VFTVRYVRSQFLHIGYVHYVAVQSSPLGIQLNCCTFYKTGSSKKNTVDLKWNILVISSPLIIVFVLILLCIASHRIFGPCLLFIGAYINSRPFHWQ
jgi:hypothetical protein